MQNYEGILDQIISKSRNETINFFLDRLSNVKNLVLSNGSEHMQNVIQWH